MNIVATGASVVSKASAIRTGLTVAALALAVGFVAGWQVHGWRTAKAELSATKADLRSVARETQRRRVIGAEHARAQREIEVFYDQLPDWWRTFVAERPALADAELGPDGLCIWNAWNAGPTGGDRPCVADQGGAAAGGEERPLPGLGGQPPPGDEAVPSDGDATERAN